MSRNDISRLEIRKRRFVCSLCGESQAPEAGVTCKACRPKSAFVEGHLYLPSGRAIFFQVSGKDDLYCSGMVGRDEVNAATRVVKAIGRAIAPSIHLTQVTHLTSAKGKRKLKQ